MKKQAVLGVVALCSVHSMATEIGLGASFNTSDKGIYFPIDLSNSFRIEPYINYSRVNEKHKYGDNISKDATRKKEEFGIGLFNKRQLSQDLNMNLGARIGYVKYEDHDERFHSERLSSEGFSFSPTLGLEYYIYTKFSISGELSVDYKKTNKENYGNYVNDSEKQDNNEESLSNSAKVVARFYF